MGLPTVIHLFHMPKRSTHFWALKLAVSIHAIYIYLLSVSGTDFDVDSWVGRPRPRKKSSNVFQRQGVRIVRAKKVCVYWHSPNPLPQPGTHISSFPSFNRRLSMRSCSSCCVFSRRQEGQQIAIPKTNS